MDIFVHCHSTDIIAIIVLKAILQFSDSLCPILSFRRDLNREKALTNNPQAFIASRHEISLNSACLILPLNILNGDSEMMLFLVIFNIARYPQS